MARISIKDIAQKVGVSNATVSLVLNGKEKEGRIRTEVADKIRQTAKELNYEPNNFARGLRMGRSQTIGLVIADISNNFFANLAFYIQEYAEKLGYTVIITNTNESGSKMQKMISALKSRQVDGFIIVPTEDGEKPIRELMNSRIPLVLLDRYFPNLPVSHVVVNNYHASYDATQLLMKSGCRHIAQVIYNNKLPHMQERKRGCAEALKSAKIYDPSIIKEINYQNISEDINDSIDDLLSRESKVDGIFFATNSISMLGIRRLLDRGVRIPEDIRVVCFDKSDAFDFASIPIPYIQQPIRDMGKKSVELLIEQIKKETTVSTHTELFASLSNAPEY